MPDLFRAYKVLGSKIPAYFIESTAPDNVDDKPAPASTISGLQLIAPDTAVAEIASHLSEAEEPNLVVMVHGFNNPQSAVLDTYAQASRVIEADPAISGKKGLVCVGYRWPSEKMGAPWRSFLTALPSLPTWAFILGAILIVVGLLAVCPLFFTASRTTHGLAIGGLIFIFFGLLIAGIVPCAWLLRVVVYFRDGYRAANFGAPDLVEIVRQVDRAVTHHDAQRLQLDRPAALVHRSTRRIQLSFIGHSMGGFVVTNAIRILSDLFATDAVRASLNTGVATDGSVEKLSPDIGNVFSLMRFVLVSPDIPAEALLSNRANFLASSLRRFREAYLFSNEGDEVLRLISTAANYFSFPTKSWKFGYRLGNVEILSKSYGLIQPAGQPIPQLLRVGYYTVQEIYRTLLTARGARPQDAPLQENLTEIISYFDCTDYVDIDNNGQKRPLLTFALKTKENDAQARMSWRSNARLLFDYIIWQRPNVHGGYFEGQLSQKLIYRLACLGFDATAQSWRGLPTLSNECSDKQIRVLLSPGLLGTPATARNQGVNVAVA